MSKGKKAAVFWAQETAHDSSRSRKVGRHRPRLSEIESGQKPETPATPGKLAQALNVKIDDLIP